MLILYNGSIYTQDSKQPAASAAAIENGTIYAVGNDAEILAAAPINAVKTNLEGKTVFPGLTDTHLHLENLGRSLQIVDCETPTRAECLRRVTEKARQLPPGEWIIGHGWNQNVWPEGSGSTLELDEAAPHHPVYLTDKSLHAAWANSLAFDAAGITNDTPNPADGEIVRGENGKATGILLEYAVLLIEKVIPAATPEEQYAALLKAQQQLLSFGITCAHDFDHSECFSTLQQIHLDGKLNLRIQKGLPVEDLEHAAALGLRSGFGDDFLRIGPVKMFADGAMGPKTAAMLRPFENETEYCGKLFLDSEAFFETARQVVTHGFSVAIHAIGDRANREILDGYALLRAFEQENHLPARRHRIEHAQILAPEDQNRLAAYHLTASVQPIHATSDMDISDRHLGNRAAYAYPFQSLLKNNTLLAFGSDAPVETANPFVGMHAAVTRRKANGRPGPDGWHAEQRISLQQALDAYTVGPAYAAGLENRTGKIKTGYFADLIILNRNPFLIPAEELQSIQPEATMIAGNWAWHI